LSVLIEIIGQLKATPDTSERDKRCVCVCVCVCEGSEYYGTESYAIRVSALPSSTVEIIFDDA